MSKPTQVVVLCEDLRTFLLVRGYLTRMSVNARNIRANINKGGSGYDWVFREYPTEVNSYLKQRNKYYKWLIVAIDGDQKSIAERIGQLKKTLDSCGNEDLKNLDLTREAIAQLIPCRNVETWILALNSEEVNETTDYKNAPRRSADEWDTLRRTASNHLYNMSRPNAAPTDIIPSLKVGITTLIRVEQLRAAQQNG